MPALGKIVLGSEAPALGKSVLGSEDRWAIPSEEAIALRAQEKAVRDKAKKAKKAEERKRRNAKKAKEAFEKNAAAEILQVDLSYDDEQFDMEEDTEGDKSEAPEIQEVPVAAVQICQDDTNAAFERGKKEAWTLAQKEAQQRAKKEAAQKAKREREEKAKRDAYHAKLEAMGLTLKAEREHRMGVEAEREQWKKQAEEVQRAAEEAARQKAADEASTKRREEYIRAEAYEQGKRDAEESAAKTPQTDASASAECKVTRSGSNCSVSSDGRVISFSGAGAALLEGCGPGSNLTLELAESSGDATFGVAAANYDVNNSAVQEGAHALAEDGSLHSNGTRSTEHYEPFVAGDWLRIATSADGSSFEWSKNGKRMKDVRTVVSTVVPTDTAQRNVACLGSTSGGTKWRVVDAADVRTVRAEWYEKGKREAEEKAKKDAEDAKKDAEDQAAKAAAEQAKKDAEEQAKLEAETAKRQELEKQLKVLGDQLKEAETSSGAKPEVASVERIMQFPETYTFAESGKEGKISEDRMTVSALSQLPATALIGGVVYYEATLRLELITAGDVSYVGVVAGSYDLDKPPTGVDAWSVSSRDGDLFSDDQVLKKHHSPFKRDGTRLRLKYTASATGGVLEWWVNGKEQKAVIDIDIKAKGVTFCVAGFGGSVWSIIDETEFYGTSILEWDEWEGQDGAENGGDGDEAAEDDEDEDDDDEGGGGGGNPFVLSSINNQQWEAEKQEDSDDDDDDDDEEEKDYTAATASSTLKEA
jgi:hypothetical protein